MKNNIKTVIKLSLGAGLLISIYRLMFACWHRNTSRIYSQRLHAPIEAAKETGYYVVCLDCGKEFPYDFKQMKIQEVRPHVGVINGDSIVVRSGNSSMAGVDKQEQPV